MRTMTPGEASHRPGRPGAPLESTLGFRMGRAHRSLREAWGESIADLGLSPPQAAMLRAICEEPGSGLRELARRVRTDPMNAKRLADHLEQVGLVRSMTDPSHRQRRDLAPTEAGLVLAKQVAERAARWEHRLSRLFGEAQLEQLQSLLQRLEDVLAPELHGARPPGGAATTSQEQGLWAHGPGHGWDSRYASTDRLFPAEPDEALVELAAGLPAGRALDLGAGEGRNSLWLARKGWRVTAVDLSQVALERLDAAAAKEHLAVRTVVADMGQYLAQGERFELVVIANIHPAPAQRAEILQAAASAVGPGGHLFLVGHHLASLGQAGPPDPERLYVEDSLKDAFPGLELLRLERRQRRVGDGVVPLLDVVAWAVRSQRQEGS